MPNLLYMLNKAKIENRTTQVELKLYRVTRPGRVIPPQNKLHPINRAQVSEFKEVPLLAILTRNIYPQTFSRVLVNM